MQELIDELDKIGFLDQGTLTQQPELLATVTAHSYQPGEVIYQTNADSDVLYIVRNGLIKLLSFLANGKTRIVRLHKSGAILGLNGLVNQTHDHTAMAVNDVSVYQIPHTELLRLKDDTPQLYATLLEKWYEYLNQADTWITDFSTGAIKGRIARLLLFLARFDTDTGPRIVELLTTDEMSEILGVTPESVSRTIAEFKRDDVLTPIENNSEALFSCDIKQIEHYAYS